MTSQSILLLMCVIDPYKYVRCGNRPTDVGEGSFKSQSCTSDNGQFVYCGTRRTYEKDREPPNGGFLVLCLHTRYLSIPPALYDVRPSHLEKAKWSPTKMYISIQSCQFALEHFLLELQIRAQQHLGGEHSNESTTPDINSHHFNTVIKRVTSQIVSRHLNHLFAS